MKLTAALGIAAALLVACTDSTAPTSNRIAETQNASISGPAFSRLPTQPTVIPGQYIVVFRDNASSAQTTVSALRSKHRAPVQETYSHVLHGMALALSDSEVAVMRADPNVAYVEQDQVLTITSTQTGPTWGLDRIDQRTLPLNQSFTYNADGAGVNVYMMDTGINYNHVEYAGRAFKGVDIVTPGGTAADCHGHGTHTAGTVGGTTYGVAKKVKLYAVRVFDCTGTGNVSKFIAGIDWVTANRVLPAVVNMNLGSAFSTALNSATQRAIASGVVAVVSAGNNGGDACQLSPQSASGVITVGAVDQSDRWTSFSNFGPCVALSAPGVNVMSAALGANTATAQMSGTSVSAPHVSGVAALYLSANPSATPAQVRAALITQATPNVLTGVPANTSKLYIYSGFIGTPPPVNKPPTATITAPTNGASFAQGANVTFTGTGSDPENGALSGASLTWTSSINGVIGTGTSFSKSNLSVGTHTITLTAKDAQNAIGTATRTIVITAAGGNQPPVANFTWNCTGLMPRQCAFDASTSSDDAGILLYAWNWGDGRAEARSTPTVKNTWPVSGTYTVTLMVTDGAGITNSISKQVAVPN